MPKSRMPFGPKPPARTGRRPTGGIPWALLSEPATELEGSSAFAILFTELRRHEGTDQPCLVPTADGKRSPPTSPPPNAFRC